MSFVHSGYAKSPLVPRLCQKRHDLDSLDFASDSKFQFCRFF